MSFELLSVGMYLLKHTKCLLVGMGGGSGAHLCASGFFTEKHVTHACYVKDANSDLQVVERDPGRRRAEGEGQGRPGHS